MAASRSSRFCTFLTFSGVLASAMGTEKELSKLMYRQAGVPTPKGDVAAGTRLLNEQVNQTLRTSDSLCL